MPLPAGYFTAQSLARHSIWNLQTTHGKLDITFYPSGFPAGYEQLRVRAKPREVAQTSVTVRVAALEDVEHSKRTADRPKDRDYLTRLVACKRRHKRGAKSLPCRRSYICCVGRSVANVPPAPAATSAPR